MSLRKGFRRIPPDSRGRRDVHSSLLNKSKINITFCLLRRNGNLRVFVRNLSSIFMMRSCCYVNYLSYLPRRSLICLTWWILSAYDEDGKRIRCEMKRKRCDMIFCPVRLESQQRAKQKINNGGEGNRKENAKNTWNSRAPSSVELRFVCF